MADAERVTVTRRIAAPAGKLFALVTDPRVHVEIDGSGMLQAAPDARAMTSAGDTFLMDMDREPLGDIPMGKYQVTNTVTRIEPGRLFEWNVGLEPYGSIGHVYGWELTAVSDTETEVSNYCDWTNLQPAMKERAKFPIVPVHMLERSLDNLERLATQ